MQSDDEGPMDQLHAHLDRGWDLVSRGDFPGAMRSAERSLEVDGESPEAHDLIGYIHHLEGHSDRALEHYRQALDLDELFFDAMLHAAEAHLALGDLEEALSMCEEALDVTENDAEVVDVLLLKVDILLAAGEHEEAADVVAEIPAGPYETPEVAYLVGKAKLDVGDIDGAEPLLKDAVERDPDNGDAHYYLALVLEQRKDARSATLEFLRTRQCDARAQSPAWSLPREHFERRIQLALRRLPSRVSEKLEDTLIIAADLPGVEVVADGVDPRISVLADETPPNETPRRIARVYVYQRNVERFAAVASAITDEIVRAIEREVVQLHPELAAVLSTATTADDETLS